MKLEKVLKFVLGIGLGLSLCACTINKNEKEVKQAEIELKLPTFLSGENVGANFFIPQVERFNEKYKGKYKVIVEEVVQASYAEKIKQLAAQNKLPTLVHSPGSGGIDTQWFKQAILDNDMAYDLTDFANKNKDIAEEFIEESRDFCTVNGKLICCPLIVLRPMGLYYNESLYKPDKDISKMSINEFIQSLGDNKIAFMTAENAWTTGLMLSSIIANEDGGLELLNNNADDKLWDYNNDIMVNAVTSLKELLQNKASSNTLGAAYADAANAFMSNKAAIICNGTWMNNEFLSENKDKWSNSFDGENVRTSIYPGNIALVNTRGYGDFWISNSANKEQIEAAEAFLAFRNSKEEIERYILAEGGNAPNIKYSDDFMNKLKENRLLYEFSKSINKDTKYAAPIGEVLPNSIIDVEFGKYISKLIDGSLSPKEFCNELTKKALEAKQ